MQTIRVLQPFGAFRPGDEKAFPDGQANLLVSMRKAERIDGRACDATPAAATGQPEAAAGSFAADPDEAEGLETDDGPVESPAAERVEAPPVVSRPVKEPPRGGRQAGGRGRR